MVYLDTSVLVAGLTNELQTPRIQAWLAGQSADSLAISDLVVTELSAALSIKLRTGQVTSDLRASALALFQHLVAEALTVFAVEPRHFRAAARLADQQELGLRAGDALHLAVVADHSLELCTLDRRLAQAGPTLGIRSRLV